MEKLSSNIAIPAVIAAGIWVVVSALTSGPAVFVVVGGVLCGLVTFVIGSGIRRVALHL
ncbi:MAG: hypothetical protein ACRDKL_11215 [Solirubrobacteraceae bacterium]